MENPIWILPLISVLFIAASSIMVFWSARQMVSPLARQIRYQEQKLKESDSRIDTLEKKVQQLVSEASLLHSQVRELQLGLSISERLLSIRGTPLQVAK